MTYTKQTSPSEIKISCELIEKLEKKTGTSAKGVTWEWCQFIVHSDDPYNPIICFSLWNDRIQILEPISIGDNIEVYFNISSKEFKGKYFNNLTATKINRTGPLIKERIIENLDLPF